MGRRPVNKLVYPVAGRPMVGWVVSRAARVSEVVIVGLGFDAGVVWSSVLEWVPGETPVVPVLNDPVDVPMAVTAANVLSEGLRRGVDVLLLLAGDQPTVRSKTMERLAEAAAREGAAVLDRGAPVERPSADQLEGHGPPMAFDREGARRFVDLILEEWKGERGTNILNLNPVMRRFGPFRAVPPVDDCELLNVNTPDQVREAERCLGR